VTSSWSLYPHYKSTLVFIETAAGIFCAILTKFGFSRQIFIKISNVKFDVKSSNESRAEIRMDGRTDLTKLIGPFLDLRERA